jgi:hypothetical protein
VTIALVGLSINALVHYAWRYYASRFYDTASSALQPGIVRNTLADNVGVPLALLGVAGAIAGVGKMRHLLGITAIFGLFLWFIYGVCAISVRLGGWTRAE